MRSVKVGSVHGNSHEEARKELVWGVPDSVRLLPTHAHVTAVAVVKRIRRKLNVTQTIFNSPKSFGFVFYAVGTWTSPKGNSASMVGELVNHDSRQSATIC